MELYAAFLATRLDQMIRRELDMPVDSSAFWTDRTYVLRYMRARTRDSRSLLPIAFSAILDQSTAAQWQCVETSLNPADQASRGIAVDALLKSDRWSQGPPFLKQLKETWPQRPGGTSEISNSDLEVKKTVEVFANKVNDQSDLIDKAKE